MVAFSQQPLGSLLGSRNEKSGWWGQEAVGVPGVNEPPVLLATSATVVGRLPWREIAARRSWPNLDRWEAGGWGR